MSTPLIHNTFLHISVAFVFISLYFCIFPVSDAHAGVIFRTPNSLALSQGLVGWWTFDGKDMSVNRAFDRSGQGNFGTLTGTNGVPVRTAGKLCQALSF